MPNLFPSHSKYNLSVENIEGHKYVKGPNNKYYELHSKEQTRDRHADCRKPSLIHDNVYIKATKIDNWIEKNGKITYVCADTDGRDYIWVPTTELTGQHDMPSEL